MSTERKLGSFLGVFTPTVLTILGVILYLRTGWVVGHMGLGRTILIVVLANLITLITTLSFSSIATNIRVGGGGAYYIVSRSLGLEIGGAIGLPLFLSQTFSVTLYAFGLAESIRIVWPGVPVPLAAFLIVIAVGLLAYRGAELALKIQLPIMALVAISLVVLAIGSLTKGAANGIPLHEPSGEYNFWLVFAVFFPAVTGVMAGLGLSGDLKDPQKTIPRGAILATLTGFAIYLSVPVLLAIGADPETLRQDPNVWSRIAPLGAWLILPGLWGAIFSSAVGSVLGAPRTLQALAKDRMFSRRLENLARSDRGLIIGLAISVAIALGAVLLGDLNAVAPVVTMFFLTVYSMVNIVAALESLSGNPSWRPKFKVPWQVNILGGLACLVVMFLINPIAGAIAIVIEVALFIMLVRRERQAAWGDVRRGVYEALIRWSLIHLARHPMSARNWRPHILIFVDDLVRQLDLARFGNWFSQGRGVVTVCELLLGDLLDEDFRLHKQREDLQEILDQEGLVAFAEIDVAKNIIEGITNVAQANGMAGLQSNTVLVGWPKRKERLAEFLRIMQRLERLNISMLIGRIRPRLLFPREGVRRTIHVWWGGLEHNGDLMLLLAHLLTRNPAWRGARIQLMSVAFDEATKEQTIHYLEKLIPEIRIEAEVKVIVKPEGRSVRELIHEQSADAEVGFLGLASPEKGEEEAYAQRMEELAGDLSTVFFVKNSSMFVGQLLDTGVDDDSEKKTEPQPARSS
ncbi:MAG: Na-K-Cl cotransporter [Alphaproteobacteria bacterium]